jgi:hypothetical protein
MSEALVGAMVAAMRRANRGRADAVRSAESQTPRRSEDAVAPEGVAAQCGRRAERDVAGTASSGAAWGYVVHPALMPTVYSPSDDASAASGGEEVAARRV